MFGRIDFIGVKYSNEQHLEEHAKEWEEKNFVNYFVLLLLFIHLGCHLIRKQVNQTFSIYFDFLVESTFLSA